MLVQAIPIDGDGQIQGKALVVRLFEGFPNALVARLNTVDLLNRLFSGDAALQGFYVFGKDRLAFVTRGVSRRSLSRSKQRG